MMAWRKGSPVNLSTNTTSRAVDGPLFVTVMLNSSDEPAGLGSGVTVLTMAMSA